MLLWVTLSPCLTSQTLFWVASIFAICTILTTCDPTQPMLSLASLRSLASFLIRIFIPAYSHSISWPFRAVGDWSGNPQARGFAGLLLCMVCGLKCSNFHWNRAWKLPNKPQNLFLQSSLMGLGTDHLKACFILLPWISVLPRILRRFVIPYFHIVMVY